MTSIETLAANLKNAARTGRPAMIGGGEFSPEECAALAESIRQLTASKPGAAFTVTVAGYPVSLFQTSRKSFRVEYGADVKPGLTYEKAAREMGLSIMHGLCIMDKISGNY